MYALIINPAAGNGRPLNMLPEIKAFLQKENIEYRLTETTKPGEAGTIAAEACKQGYTGIITVGGDGTILETASGMLNSGIPLIIIPCGTGNDFTRALKLPRDPLAALKQQLHAENFIVDAGMMNGHCFLNISGTGLDVDVLHKTEKYKAHSKGIIPYLRGVIDAVKNYKPTVAEISLDGGPAKEYRFCVLSIGNGRYFGGGMRAVPNALVNDGFFDVVMFSPVKKWHIPVLFALYILGLHIRLGLATVHRCRSCAVTLPGMTVNLDGELTQCDHADYRLLPGAITLRIPNPYPKGK